MVSPEDARAEAVPKFNVLVPPQYIFSEGTLHQTTMARLLEYQNTTSNQSTEKKEVKEKIIFWFSEMLKLTQKDKVFLLSCKIVPLRIAF